MTPFQLGIAVATSKLDGALHLPNGTCGAKVVTHEAHGHSDRVDWRAHKAVRPVHVGREAPGRYWEDSPPFLAPPGSTVSVVHPAQLQADAASRLTRPKTEAVAARLIAAFGAERHPPPWQARSEAEVAWRALGLRLDALQPRRLQESHRLEGARDTGRPHSPEPLDGRAPPIETLTATLNPHLASKPNRQGQRDVLDSIPGRGEGTIAILLAVVAAPSRVANRRQAAAFGGREPRQHASGTRVTTTPRLSQSGHAFLRQAL